MEEGEKMSEVNKKCKYKSRITGWECPYEALDDSKDGFCIFHERRKDKDIKKFNEGIKKILEDEGSDAYHFEGFFFPDTVSFKGFEFKKSVFFCEAEFLGEYTDFCEAKFSGETTDFVGTKFSGANTGFYKAVFSGRKTLFGNAKFSGRLLDLSADFSGEKTDFSAAEFSGENMLFSGAKFLADRTNFTIAKFSGRYIDFCLVEFGGWNTDFWGAKFSGETTVFNGTKFVSEKTDFIESRFSGKQTDFGWTKFLGGETVFLWSIFSGDEVNFFYPEFKSKILFYRNSFEANTTFTGVDLSTCLFAEVDLENVVFSLLDWDWKRRLGNERELFRIALRESLQYSPTAVYERVDAEEGGKERWEESEFYLNTSEIYRQLKVQFHKIRDFAKAGMFHFREQECKRKACKLPKDFFKWIFLWILKLSCGYGEKLRNVGLTSVALVFLFAFVYMFLGLHNVNDGSISRNFCTSLIFSIKGFFPLWRFQQYKVVGDVANLVAGLEFLLGAFMVGLFIYVFRRRMEK